MIIYNYPSDAAYQAVSSIVNRGLGFSAKEYKTVEEILADVKNNGDKAVIKYTNRFDAPNLMEESLIVTEAEFDIARKNIHKDFLLALDRAASQIETYHKKQLENSWITHERKGVMLGQMVNPVDAVGVYAPGAKGGETPLVSSVLMGSIPAKIAGVKKIVLATPPKKDGSIDPHLLMAAKKVGIDTVYKAGSAWAIAAFSYGTKSIQKVDVIVGPGNIYVTLAKKIVSGTVGIDMIAGPSEILIIADNTANPEYIAADLLSQAEHDIMASAVLVTTSKEVAQKTVKALEEQLTKLSRREIAQKSITDFGAVMIVKNIETAIELSNKLAPEHLELLVQEPFEYLGQIRNAGAVFLGEYTPEPVGDYVAGPNHVLPTAGTARFSSALSVEHFTKKTSIISYSKAALKEEAKDIICLAKIEGLEGHANSIKIRLEDI